MTALLTSPIRRKTHQILVKAPTSFSSHPSTSIATVPDFRPPRTGPPRNFRPAEERNKSMRLAAREAPTCASCTSVDIRPRDRGLLGRDRHFGPRRASRRLLVRRRHRRHVADDRERQRRSTRVRPGATAGKTKGALSFDGVNDLVTIADSASLDLSTGMTSRPGFARPRSALAHRRRQGAQWRNRVCASCEPGRIEAGGQVDIGGEQDAVGLAPLPLNAWSHLARDV